jgi:aminopeptidase N
VTLKHFSFHENYFIQNEHRANFTIGINHDASYRALSNMAEMARTELASNRVVTFFHETNLISPSSLAFFVSGFKEVIQGTRRNGFKHLVSVRETEMDYKEKLFEMTELILDAVESFMNVDLPHEVIHSVALPNFGRDVGSFYGFNIYR